MEIIRKTLGTLATLIVLLVALHYFFSYKAVLFLLHQLDINPVSVLSMEDLMFPLADVHLKLLVCLLGLFMVLVFYPLRGFRWFNRFIESEKWVVWAMGVLILLGIICSIWKYSMFCFIVLLFVTLGMGFVYLLSPKKLQLFILTCLILFTLLNIQIFYSYVFHKETRKEIASQIIEFQYKNEIVRTSESLKLVYWGTKYIVLSDGQESFLYPTGEIGKIKVMKE